MADRTAILHNPNIVDMVVEELKAQQQPNLLELQQQFKNLLSDYHDTVQRMGITPQQIQEAMSSTAGMQHMATAIIDYREESDVPQVEGLVNKLEKPFDNWHMMIVGAIIVLVMGILAFFLYKNPGYLSALSNIDPRVAMGALVGILLMVGMALYYTKVR